MDVTYNCLQLLMIVTYYIPMGPKNARIFALKKKKRLFRGRHQTSYLPLFPF